MKWSVPVFLLLMSLLYSGLAISDTASTSICESVRRPRIAFLADGDERANAIRSSANTPLAETKYPARAVSDSFPLFSTVRLTR